MLLCMYRIMVSKKYIPVTSYPPMQVLREGDAKCLQSIALHQRCAVRGAGRPATQPSVALALCAFLSRLTYSTTSPSSDAFTTWL